MPRKRKDQVSGQSASEQARIRLSPAQKARIRAAAEALGLSISEYLLRAGLAMSDVGDGEDGER